MLGKRVSVTFTARRVVALPDGSSVELVSSVTQDSDHEDKQGDLREVRRLVMSDLDDAVDDLSSRDNCQKICRAVAP